MKTRPHKEEMIRFAKSEVGTQVWFRQKTGTGWSTVLKPAWDKDYIYVVHNKYANLRKDSADTGRPIQIRNKTGKWETPTHELQFDVDLEFYRLEPKKEEFKYPIYKRFIYKDSVYNGCVVEFIGGTEGVIVEDTEMSRASNHNIGYKSHSWIHHTNTRAWEDYDYIEPIYYYQWERLSSKGEILVSNLISDRYAEKNGYREEGWVKRTSTKRTWEY